MRLSIQFTQPFGYHLIRQVIALCGDYEPQALRLLLPAYKIAYQRLYAALGELCPFKKGYEVIILNEELDNNFISFLEYKYPNTHFKRVDAEFEGEQGSEEEKKTLDNPVIAVKTVDIEGMHCENCKNSIERSVNKIDGASCQVNLKKKQATIEVDREIDDADIRIAIERLDFKVTGITTNSKEK